MTQYAFYFNGNRCTGCKACQLACADYNDLSSDYWYRRVYEFGGGTWTQDAQGAWTTDAFTYYVSLGCQHCTNPACTKVCPTGAMHKDADTGLVSVDTTRCVGCGYCHMACPYNVPRVNREAGHSVKCDGCKDRVAEGKNPICVDACPLRALNFGTVEEMSALGEQASIAPLPTKTLTEPNLYITNPANAQPAEGFSGQIENVSEVY